MPLGTSGILNAPGEELVFTCGEQEDFPFPFFLPYLPESGVRGFGHNSPSVVRFDSYRLPRFCLNKKVIIHGAWLLIALTVRDLIFFCDKP